MRTKYSLLLFIIVWTTVSLGLFVFYSGEDKYQINDNDQLKQLRDDIADLKKELSEAHKIPPALSPAPSIDTSKSRQINLQNTQQLQPPAFTITENIASKTPTPLPSPSSSKYPLEKNIINRELHENKSKTETTWFENENFATKFLKAYSALFRTEEATSSLEAFLNPPLETPSAVKKQTSVEILTQIETERWKDVKRNLVTKFIGDEEEEIVASCAGAIDEISGEDLVPFNALVLGSGVGYFVESLAKQYPDSTILCFERRQEYSAIHYERIQNMSFSNTYICQHPLNAKLASELGSSSGFFRFQFILDLIPLLDELLPHEFEGTLGQLFSISQTTFLFIPDDREDGIEAHSRFFQYWNDFNELIYNAAEQANLPKPSVSFLAQHRVYRVDMVESFKKSWNVCTSANETHCTSKQDSLSFSFNEKNLYSSKFPVASVSGQSPDRKPSLCSAIPLHYLLDFELIPQQAGTLASHFAFSKLLKSPHESASLAKLVVPDLLYVYQNHFIMAPFATSRDLWIVGDDDDLLDDFDELDEFYELPIQAPKGTPILTDPVKPEKPKPKDPVVDLPQNEPEPIPAASRIPKVVQSTAEYEQWLYEELQSNQNNQLVNTKYYYEEDAPEDEEELAESSNLQKAKIPIELPLTSDYYYDEELNQQGEPPARRQLLFWDWNSLNIQLTEGADTPAQHPSRSGNQVISPKPDTKSETKLGTKSGTKSESTKSKWNLITEDFIPKRSKSYDNYLRTRSVQEFEELWQVLDSQLQTIGDPAGLWIVPESRTGLLPTKLAKKFPKGTVLSIESSTVAVEEQEKLVSILGQDSSVLLCTCNYYDPRILQELNTKATLARYQVLDGRHLFSLLNTMPLLHFQSYLAQSLSLSATTFLYMPPYETLQTAASLFQISLGHVDTMQDFLQSVVSQSGTIHEAAFRSIPLDSGSHLWIIDIAEGIRSVSIGSQSYDIEFSVRNNRLRVSVPGAVHPNAHLNVFGYRVDTNSLLHMNMSYAKKQQIIQSYLTLDMFDNMHPSTLFADGAGSLIHYSPQEVRLSHSTTDIQSQKIEEALANSIGRDSFSLLHVNSGDGRTSSLLAQTHPNATIVSIEEDKALSLDHFTLTEEYRIYNNLVCRKTPTPELIDLIRSSPEFFEYLLVSNISKIINEQSKYSRTYLVDYFTKLSSLGITTYFQFPSSRLVSLVATTFYSDAFKDTDLVFSYDYRDHPLEPWKNSGLKFVHSVINGHGVHDILISELPNVDPSIEFIEVRLLNMSRTVGHHFRLPEHQWTEQHKTKYELHHFYGETYLIRDRDEKKIIYDSFGISLVAALRLGPYAETKDRLYNEFLKIPIYEDMAPWNIQFKGGELHYVDKDSAEGSLDWLLPYAYQFIISLLNWRQTISSFGRCGEERSIGEGAPLLGLCMGGNLSDKKCTDRENPVPCADGNCYPTFVDCLRALSLIEDALLQTFKTPQPINHQTNININYNDL